MPPDEYPVAARIKELQLEKAQAERAANGSRLRSFSVIKQAVSKTLSIVRRNELHNEASHKRTALPESTVPSVPPREAQHAVDSKQAQAAATSAKNDGLEEVLEDLRQTTIADRNLLNIEIISGSTRSRSPLGLDEDILNVPLKRRRTPEQHDFMRKHTSIDPNANVPDGLQPGSLCQSQFNIHDEIGSGTFGKVYYVTDKATRFACAAKVMKKKEINTTSWLLREVKIHQQLEHPHIIKFYDCWQNAEEVTLLLEYAPVGSLYDILRLRDPMTLEDEWAATVVLQLASALKYLHSKDFIHRDIKTDNVLVDENWDVKLCDFGWAVEKGPTGRRGSIHGTLDYRSPESFEPKNGVITYDEKIDIWALGVLLFEVVHGRDPFYAQKDQTIRKIVKVQYVISGNVSSGAADLIRKILVKDPAKRSTLTEITEHPWIRQHTQLQPSQG